jgi:hypothetical protein
MNLTKPSQDALDAFDASAQNWGWEVNSATGTPSRVAASKKAYDETRDALIDRILFLEECKN